MCATVDRTCLAHKTLFRTRLAGPASVRHTWRSGWQVEARGQMAARGGTEDSGAEPVAEPLGPSASVGGRVRALRRASAMSQSELAGGRFSKEYVSQIERGKTRPTVETLDWLANRLGTDRDFLEHGLSTADAAQAEETFRRAEELVEAHLYADAAAAFHDARDAATDVGAPELVLRGLRGQAWAEIWGGNVEAARSLLAEAQRLSADSRFTDVDRADLLFLVGVCDYTASNTEVAVATFGQALELAELSGLACDRLRCDIFLWRAPCYRRLRDWPGAREDTAHALELASARGDSRQTARALVQACLNAQREGHWLLARRYAEESMALFAQLGDRVNVARLLNNVAGANHLLGNSETAVAQLKEAFEIFVDLNRAAEAGYVLSSLADVHLSVGDAESAETQARKAIVLLADRSDHLQEIGTAHLALGRSLLAQGRLEEAEKEFDTADDTFSRVASASHQADSWIARGALARRGGEEREAARLYRRAAATLLDTSS